VIKPVENLPNGPLGKVERLELPEI